MKFATIGHLNDYNSLEKIPEEYIKKNFIISPEINFNGVKGHILGLKLTAKEMMKRPLKDVRKKILEGALIAEKELQVELVQLGALTTSVTSAGKWLTKQKKYSGYVTHGDSYTAAITCQTVEKILNLYGKEKTELCLSIIGAYGVIGEAVSKILVPKFRHTQLIGRRENKLQELSSQLEGRFETDLKLNTKKADIIVTATSHPKALLNSNHLKKDAIIVDVSQPPNLSLKVCQERKDITRVDGGYVDSPMGKKIPIPGVPKGKIFSCIAEAIMQSAEDQKQNHVGSIDLKFLRKTVKWGEKYNYKIKELTNFGRKL